jgi:hypothetical protein
MTYVYRSDPSVTNAQLAPEGEIVIFGMSILTFVHVLLSLIGILAGLIVMVGLLTSKQSKGWTALFIWTTVATSVSGFLFPFHRFLPSHAIGIISLVALSVAIYALYGLSLAGAWRRIYAVTAMISLYLNVFVLIFQLFDKVPALKAIAPTKTEGPFKEAQLAALLAFVVLTILAAIKFRIEPIQPASS